MPSSKTSSSEDDNELRKGPWTLEEDNMLAQFIANNGEGRWNLLAKCSGLKRTGKSCRLRWLNYLKPDLKRGNLTPEEQLLILELHVRWGNRWSKIAQHLPGRTDNEIKNYWRTRIQKQARHLKIDTESKEFQELVRRYWIPKLLQKAKDTPSSTMPILNQETPLPHSTVAQFGATETIPTQIPWEGHGMNEACPKYLDQDDEQINTDSEHNNGSCISFSESANFPKVPHFLGYSNNQFHDFGTFTYDDGNYVNAYEMNTSNLTTTRAAELICLAQSL